MKWEYQTMGIIEGELHHDGGIWIEIRLTKPLTVKKRGSIPPISYKKNKIIMVFKKLIKEI